MPKPAPSLGAMIVVEAQRQHDERLWRAESIDAEIGWKNLTDG